MTAFSFVEDIEMPKKPKKLPVVLSKEEAKKMIEVTINLKHKLVLMLLYSGGLRLSEVINLKWEDVDFLRNVLNVIQSKGKKDRITLLSKKTKSFLKEFSKSQIDPLVKAIIIILFFFSFLVFFLALMAFRDVHKLDVD